MSIEPRLQRPLGVLSVLASLPILEASLMAAYAFFMEGDNLRTFLGSLGSLGGTFLLVAGVLLFTKRQLGRRIAYWGSVASIVAHTLGALIGLVGGHGVLYGVGFPVAIVLLLRITPSRGSPPEPQSPQTPSTISHDKRLLRVAAV
jgi:membrane-bound metal-dependent hydrolase YbcI (DUF457 family)